MLKFVTPLIIIMALILGSGCRGQPAPASASLGQAFSLNVGQSVSFPGQNLEIKFLDLIGDSRCPINVVCIWAGEATCQVEITSAGELNLSKLWLSLVPALNMRPPASTTTKYSLMSSLIRKPGNRYLREIIT